MPAPPPPPLALIVTPPVVSADNVTLVPASRLRIDCVVLLILLVLKTGIVPPTQGFHCPSPKKQVVELAPVPPPKCETGRFPLTCLPRSICWAEAIPANNRINVSNLVPIPSNNVVSR